MVSLYPGHKDSEMFIERLRTPVKANWTSDKMKKLGSTNSYENEGATVQQMKIDLVILFMNCLLKYILGNHKTDNKDVNKVCLSQTSFTRN